MRDSYTNRNHRPSHEMWSYERDGRIRGMVAREGFVYEQKPLSVTRNVVV